MKNLNLKIKNSGLWQVSELSFQVILHFVYFSVMTRIISKEDYGILALATGVVGFGNIFVRGGMGSALVQRKNHSHKHVNAALQIGLLFGFSIYFIIFFSSPWIGRLYENEDLSAIIRAIAVNIILFAVVNIGLNLLYKELNFKKSFIVEIPSLILGYSLGVFLAINNYGVWSIVAASIFTSFIKLIIIIYYTKMRFSFAISLKETKEIFHFGSGMIFMSLSNFFSSQGLNLILGQILTTEILGIYDRANQIRNLPSQYLGNLIDRVMFPVMSKMQDDNQKLIRLFNFTMGFSNSISIPLASYLILFTPEIVNIMMGSDWRDTIIPIQILLITVPFGNAGRMADSVIRAKGLVYKNVKRKYAFTIVLIALCTILGIPYGINGVATAITISYVFNYLMMIYLVKSVFKIDFGTFFKLPLYEGIKLGFVIILAVCFFKSAFGLWFEPSILAFTFFTSAIAAIIFVIIKIKPSLLGHYLYKVSLSFSNKSS